MRRALQLARQGEGYTSPNPMVGAVITACGRVIGQGFHRRCGGPHAEVWAVRSVSDDDRALLAGATVYVTLEPCSHYGKTPPCAKLLAETGVRRVVIGCLDPNPRVSGRGVELLREAGIEVCVGVMADECFALNRRFMVAQIKQRPYILLKWAMSADGYLDRLRDVPDEPARFSTPLSLQSMHTLRARHDAVLVGAGTVIADNPSLTVRLCAGLQPRPVVVDRRGRVPAGAALFGGGGAIYVSSVVRHDLPSGVERVMVSPDAGIHQVVDALKCQCGISSLMVEGGAEMVRSFVEAGLWDDARIEVAPFSLGVEGGVRLAIPGGTLRFETTYAPNIIINVKNEAWDGKSCHCVFPSLFKTYIHHQI